jgi:hypothetical protein
MTKLDHAQFFLSQGIGIIPLRHRGKEPASELINGSWERYKTNLPTEYDLDRWLHSTWQNYGVVCGWGNLVVLDFDTQDAFDKWVTMVLSRLVTIPYIVKSARGAHVYISCSTINANEKREGVDVKCHGYVAGPGSVHPTGAIYTPTTEYRLVGVSELETILPVDLFPKIVPSPSCAILGHSSSWLTTANDGLKANDYPPAEYDPFQAAMWASDTDLITVVKSRVRIEMFFKDPQRTSANGQWYAVLCPFHDDHNPSAWIDTKRQLFGCQTCGGKALDVINMYARMHGMSESDAVSAMARECGVWA